MWVMFNRFSLIYTYIFKRLIAKTQSEGITKKRAVSAISILNVYL